MISVEEAQRLVERAIRPAAVEWIGLSNALGRWLAGPVAAPFDHPRFDNSAVDGYAFAFVHASNDFEVVAHVAAGQTFGKALSKGQCARIFTGAQLPEGTDTVVMQEHCSIREDRMQITDVKLKKGANVRKQGEEIRSDDALLGRGHRVDASTLGLLASVGVEQISVFKPPRIAVIVTGSEFTTPSEAHDGRIFNSNGPMLSAALRPYATEVNVVQVNDELKMLKQAFASVISAYDIVISTGGVSVGDHDHVREVHTEIGAEIIFHKVAQKPGKPMLFAQRDEKIIFGLPGNPRAVMIACWEYVIPYINGCMGQDAPFSSDEQLPIAHAFDRKGDRAEFLAVRIIDGHATVLQDQRSHMLRSLTEADAIAYLAADRTELEPGDLLPLRRLP